MRLRTLVALALALAAGLARAAVPTPNSIAGPYACDGITVTFAIPYRFLEASHLVVTRTTGTTVTTLASGTDYTVTGAGGTSGTLILAAASKCSSGSTLAIRRRVPWGQPYSFSSSGTFNPRAHEAALDRLAMQVEQLDQDRADLAAKQTADVSALSAINTAGAADASALAPLPSGATTRRTLADVLTDSLKVRDFGAVGDGNADDTAALQRALDRAASLGGRDILLHPGTYRVSKGTSAYVLSAYSGVRLIGVPGKTTIKVTSCASDCYILGSASHVDGFAVEGVIFDGSAVAGAVYGMEFPDIGKFVSQDNAYAGLRIGVEIGSSVSPLASDVTSLRDRFASITQHGVRAYNVLRLRVLDGTFLDFRDSPIDTNPLATANSEGHITLRGNTITCDNARWVMTPAPHSVLSLLADSVEVQDNRITGGGAGGQIIVHSVFTRTTSSYHITGNHLYSSMGPGILVNTDVNSQVTISSNTVSGAVGSSIAVNGSWNGSPSSLTPGLISIAGNVVSDGLTGTTYTDSNQPGGIKLTGTSNVAVTGNVIYQPRYAGIYVIADARNIVIAGNLVTGHQGQAPTDVPTWHGGGIMVKDEAVTSYLGTIAIHDNVVQNYLTTQSGSPPLNDRNGGIVVNGSGSKVQDVTVRGNTVLSGSGYAVSVSAVVNASISDNHVAGYSGQAYNLVSASTTTWRTMEGVPFSQFVPVGNGSTVYCSDCVVAAACAAGGTGAMAKRINGAWVCN